jgi:hypothetical protein
VIYLIHEAEQLTAVTERLSDEQIDALLSFAQSMAGKPFCDRASPRSARVARARTG